jgi:hypothetical protein
VCAKLRGVCFIMLISSTFFGFFLLFSPDSSSAATYRELALRMQRRFTLYGSLQLSYERRWYEGASSHPAQVEVTKSLDLGVRGFVVDPRLINFDISGLIERDSRKNFGRSYTLTETRIDVMLLESLPWRLMRYWMFIPNPILLRFNRVSDTHSSTNYGITLTYRMPKQVKRHNGNGGNGGGFRFPLTVFDYDHYDYTGDGGYKSSSNLYSLRSSLQGKTYDYRFLAEKLDQKGSALSSRDTVEFEPDYRFYDPETRRTWDIYNLLRYEKINDTKNYQGRSLALYRRPMGDSGRDLLTVTGDLNLSRSSDGLARSAYNASVTAQYNMRLSKELFVAPYAAIGYTMREGEDMGQESAHYERAGSGITAELSRIFRNTSSVFIGNGQNGLEYGVSTSFATKTRISASAGYSLSSTSTPDGKVSVQRFVIGASGPLRANLSFDSRAYYTFQDKSGDGIGSPFYIGTCTGLGCTEYLTQYASSEDSLSAAANLYWLFGANSVSAGGTWSRTTTKHISTKSITTSTLQASLSRPLTRRTFFNVYSSWTTDSQKNDWFEVLPRLVWRRGRTWVNVDYDYRRTATLGGSPVVENRFFIRFVRYFSHGFRL